MIRLTGLVNPPASFFLTTRHIFPTVQLLTSLSSPLLSRLSCHLSVRRLRVMEPENLTGSITDGFVTVEKPLDVDSTSFPAQDNPNFVHVERNGDIEGDGASVVGVEGVNSGLDEEGRIMRNVVVLSAENCNGDTCNVYVVGTAHISEESCKEVQAVIGYLKPEAVFLELCSSRVHLLTAKDLKVPTFSDMLNMWKKKHNLFGIMYSWFLAKVADEMEVLPGSEFRVAFEEAMKCGSKVMLGDRPVNVTLRRTWGKMPLWHKTKLIYSLVFQAVFLPKSEDINKMLKEFDNVDMLTLVIQEMSREFPTLMETLVNERDKYMSSKLFNLAREHTSVVAVVGKGHLLGIRKHWKEHIEISELMEIPSRSPIISVVKVLSTVGVVVAGAAIVSGIFFASKKQS